MEEETLKLFCICTDPNCDFKGFLMAHESPDCPKCGAATRVSNILSERIDPPGPEFKYTGKKRFT